MLDARVRELVLPGLIALAGIVVLASLGFWQLDRLAWKRELVARAEARPTAPVVSLPAESEWSSVDAERDEYRRVRVTGRFLHDQEVLVYTLLSQPKGRYYGPGYWVLTPLQLQSGAVVIVNRGFVPDEFKDPAKRSEGQIGGEVTVTGLLRLPDPQNWFTPRPDTKRGIWFRRDPIEIAKTYGLGRTAPFLIDADATPNPGGLPQGGETLLSFPNNHLQYAITWFGLAAALACVFAAFAWARLTEEE